MILLLPRKYLLVVFYLGSLVIHGTMCRIRSTEIMQCGCTQKVVNTTLTSPCDLVNVIGDSKHKLGKVEIKIPYLSTRGSGKYRIILTAYKCIDKHTKCNFSESSTRRQQHSIIEYTNYEPQKCISSCPNQTLPTVTFQYVFSGKYSLAIESTEFQCPIDIETDYKNENANQCVPHIQVHDKQNIQKITVVMQPKCFLRRPNMYTSLMEENCNDPKCMQLKGITRIYADDSNPNKYREQFINVSENTNNVTWHCSYMKNSVNLIFYVCTPATLRPANYSFTFEILNEICTNDLMHWSPFAVCMGNHIFNINSSNTLIVPTYQVARDDTNAISIVCFIAGIILIVAIFAIPIYIHRHFYITRSRRSRSNTTNTSYESLLPPINEIIVMYAQDFEMFTTMIAALKSLLTSVKNIIVTDINVMDENICQDPHDWIKNKIEDKNTKIVLFLNNRIVDMYQNRLLRRDVHLIWQDNLILYTIKQLQFSKFVNYTNLYITHLNKITDHVKIFDDLNTATRYIMPNSINTLLQDIFQTQPNLNNNLLFDFEYLCQECIKIESIDNHNNNNNNNRSLFSFLRYFSSIIMYYNTK